MNTPAEGVASDQWKGWGEPKAALARARLAALAELKSKPRVWPWRHHALAFGLVVMGTTAVAAVGAWFESLYSGERFAIKSGALLALVSVQALGCYTALVPRARRLGVVVIALAVFAMAFLVSGRLFDVSTSPRPGWVCSATHFGLDVIPSMAALLWLRQTAWRIGRALAAGLAAGATGAVLGELVCERGWQHAALHHVGIWLLVVITVTVASRALVPRSFAP